MNTPRFPRTFEGWVDFAEKTVRYLLLTLSVVAIGALATGDVWIGAGSINQVVQKDHVGWLISLATSGVLAALLLIPAYGIWKRWPWWKILLASIPAAIPYIFDSYFDMHYADVLKYEVMNVDTSQLASTDKTVLYMLRGLMLSITTFGDPITVIVISGFGVIKWALGGKLTETTRPLDSTPYTTRPAPQPISSPLSPTSSLGRPAPKPMNVGFTGIYPDPTYNIPSQSNAVLRPASSLGRPAPKPMTQQAEGESEEEYRTRVRAYARR